ncbi:PLD nuclease N-terminal domain-containing protein [Georgenia sp. AZ-5]|uniref:PLD nuclease N-terminal domain-containing protein n=1 Tax=Georgenia sp. AZ-5 TaxID=3367526 RepID=UPI0037543468
MPRVVAVVLLLAVIIYALIDCVRTPGPSMPAGIPKAGWVVLILVFPGLGAVAWLVISRVARAETGGRGGAARRPGQWSPGPSRPGRRSGPVAPDDDPDFLARLEAERRRAARQKRGAAGDAGTAGKAGTAEDAGTAGRAGGPGDGDGADGADGTDGAGAAGTGGARGSAASGGAPRGTGGDSSSGDAADGPAATPDGDGEDTGTPRA